jgi:hypothetical protein
VVGLSFRVLWIVPKNVLEQLLIACRRSMIVWTGLVVELLKLLLPMVVTSVQLLLRPESGVRLVDLG